MWGRSENFHFQGVVALSRVGGGGVNFLEGGSYPNAYYGVHIESS